MNYMPKKNIIDVDLDDKKVILNIDSGIYYELNHTSSNIFEFLKSGPKNQLQIKEHLKNIYDVSDEVLEKSLNHFLDNKEIFTTSVDG